MKTRKFGVSFLSLLLSLVVFSQENPTRRKAYIVSNAHFDTQWNWDVQKSISEFIPKTMNQNLMLLGKYPDYIFNFEGGIKYAWMKEYFPLQYELIKKYIAEGRWHITGSTWDANDTNIPSPESFTRNILYGQTFYEKEFGVRGTDIFLPDCFGFSWTLPTIAAHSGLIGFSTQKLQWRHQPFHNGSKIPFEIGLWQGIDGSRIMMVADAHNYTTKWRDEDLSKSDYLSKITAESPIRSVYHYYGTGDTGGAPTIESVRAVEKGVSGNGPVKILSAKSDQLYKDYLPYDKHPELPVYSGELLMDVHATGCYTSQAAMKLYNRRNELLADAAERSSVIADWLGALTYPKQNLTEAWKRVIWHQFHDDLTGTSIPKAYEFSWNDELISLKQFANILQSSSGAISRSLDTEVKGIPLVIYNSNAFPVSDVIKISFRMSKPNRDFAVFDEYGKRVATQTLSIDGDLVTLLVAANMPSCGYVVYDVRNDHSKQNNTLKAETNTIENSVYKVTVDKYGDISSVYDKKNKKELVKQGKSIRLALFTENESFSWPAWELLKKEIDKKPVSITDAVKISIVENGPLRASLCVEKRYGDSSFKQYICLNEGKQADRIDINNEVDWQTTNALLKAEFPLNVTNAEATYDLGVGAVKRGNNTDIAYEVFAQHWADLTDKSDAYGVSVLNDCKYGWDKPDDNTIRLTLLHTPKTQGNYTYQNRQDFGKHIFTYSIIGHTGDYLQAGIVEKAEILNQTPKAFIAPKHKGELGRTFSFMQNSNKNVIIKALKQAEKSDEYVVRLYETTGKSNQKTTLNFISGIISAKELNGVEDEIGNVRFSGNRLDFEIKPFGMKTFKIKLATPQNRTSAIESLPLALPHNMKATTYNAFMSDANFDGKGNSFSAELWPGEIHFNGINFQLAGADTLNAVKCRGQVIDLPRGNYNRIYLLVASTGNDTKAGFSIDGKQQKEMTIPAYTGFIGQWGHSGHTEAFLKPADIAFVGTHRHNMVFKRDLPYEFTYMFAVSIDIPQGAKQLTLPDNARIVVFAGSVAVDRSNVLTPAVNLLHVGLPEADIKDQSFSRKNLLYGKTIIGKSGEINRQEKAEFAIDEDTNTKWCDVSINKPKFITIDLGKEETIRGWSVFHAGLEDLDYTTKDYSLMVKTTDESEWKVIDSVTDNTALETDRLLQSPIKARYVRLNVTKPDQSEGATVRIYDFQVY